MKLEKNRKAFIKYYLPLIVISASLLLFFICLGFLENSGCTYILNINLGYINIVVLTYVLPSAIVLATIYMAIYGYKVIKYKYCYPLDIPVINDKESNISFLCQIKGFILFLSPLVAIYLSYVGNETYDEFLKDSDVSAFIEKLEENCSHTQRNQGVRLVDLKIFWC